MLCGDFGRQLSYETYFYYLILWVIKILYENKYYVLIKWMIGQEALTRNDSYGNLLRLKNSFAFKAWSLTKIGLSTQAQTHNGWTRWTSNSVCSHRKGQVHRGTSGNNPLCEILPMKPGSPSSNHPEWDVQEHVLFSGDAACCVQTH